MAFQVLIARQIGIGEAYLILAERRTGSGYPIVESFLIVPKAQNCYRSKVFSLKRPDFDVPAEVLREIDLNRVARQTAEEELEAEVVAWWRAQIPGTPLPEPVRFSDTDRGAIVSLWLRQVCPDSITGMRRDSRDSDLTQFLQQVVYLPTLAPQP